MADSDVRTNPLNRLRACFVRRRVVDDQGMALIAMILLATVMSLIAGVIVVDSTTELRRSTVQVDKTSALQAAQAGIDNYLSKMTQDNLYYFHYVHAAEPVRTGSTPVCTAPDVAPCTYQWTGASTWTYDLLPQRWEALGTEGYEYRLNITAPSATDSAVTIVATGRKVGDTNMINWRAIQTKVRGSSVADYQMVADSDVNYGGNASGAGATTNGRIYSTANIHFRNGTVFTNANVLAEGQIINDTGANAGTHLLGGTPLAKDYDLDTPFAAPNNIRSQIASPVVFSTFTTAISTVQAVASGVSGQPFFLDDSTVKTWSLVFTSNGKVSIAKCTGAAGVVVEAVTGATIPTPPTCAAPYATVNVPTIGAIYTGQDVMVKGVVEGRVTIASNDNIYIAGNLTYDTPVGQNVLGLIARNNVVVPEFAPYPLPGGDMTWYSASVAMTGAERMGNESGNWASGVGELFRYGSTATADSPVMNILFPAGRSYNYDPTLAFLQPPFFPVISVNYDVLLFREITPTP